MPNGTRARPETTRPEVEEVKAGVWSCPEHPEELLPRADRAPRCPACDRAEEAGDA